MHEVLNALEVAVRSAPGQAMTASLEINSVPWDPSKPATHEMMEHATWNGRIMNSTQYMTEFSDSKTRVLIADKERAIYVLAQPATQTAPSLDRWGEFSALVLQKGKVSSSEIPANGGGMFSVQFEMPEEQPLPQLATVKYTMQSSPPRMISMECAFRSGGALSSYSVHYCDMTPGRIDSRLSQAPLEHVLTDGTLNPAYKGYRLVDLRKHH